MIITVEISLYPLQSDYEEEIIRFVKNMKNREGLSVYTTAMSTYIKGEYSEVMNAITEEAASIFVSASKKVLVMKLLNAAAPIENGYLEL